ncbi:MAG: metallophosphoesterase [Tatlockia sp.]|nr:metallophosphoesterase [Tatlockia sp.]
MPNYLKVIQLSDTHLFADDESEMKGVKSNLRFKTVIEQIYAEELTDTDLIFLTGDLSQDETEQSYQKLVDSLAPFHIPVYWIPGNHDHLPTMESVFKKANNFSRVHELIKNGWKFIFLNTKLDRSVEGYLANSQLQILQERIDATEENTKIAIVMHHHPIEVHTPLIDQFILKNKAEFWDMISGTPVELVICGHVHGDYKIKYNNIMLESAPATCLQWQKGTKNLIIEPEIGYKIYLFDQRGYQSRTKLWRCSKG